MYPIYANKRPAAYLIFRASSAELIRGRRLLQIGRDKDIFSFNLKVYFLSVRKFYTNYWKPALIVIIRFVCHF